MGNQAIRKPRFLENVEPTSDVLPLSFGLSKDKQENLGVVQNLDLEKTSESTPVPPPSPTEENEEHASAAPVEDDASPTNLPQNTGADLPTPDQAETEMPTEAETGEDMRQADLQADQPAPVEPSFASSPAQDPLSPDMGLSANIATEKMIRMIEHLRQANTRLAEEARSTALEIGFQVAQRILEREVSADVTAMIALVRSALRKVGDAKVLRLSLHPQDHESVAKALEDGQFTEIALAQLELVPNASLERGDVVVDTDFGQIDGRIKTRLKEIKTVIDDSQEGEPS